MANELAASINIDDLGLGGGIDNTTWNSEMLMLTREIRDAMVEMSRVSRREGFFGNQEGGIVAGITKGLAGLGTFIAGSIAAAMYTVVLGEKYFQSADDPYFTDPNKQQGTESDGLMAGNDFSKFQDRFMLGQNESFSNEQNIASVLEDQRAIYDKILKIQNDSIDDSRQKVDLQNLQKLLEEDFVILQKLQNDGIIDSVDATKMLSEGMSENGLYVEAINSLLTDQTNQLTNSVEVQKKLTEETMRTADQQERLNYLREKAMRISAKLTRGESKVATFNTEALGGQKSFTVTAVSGWADAVRRGDYADDRG